MYVYIYQVKNQGYGTICSVKCVVRVKVAIVAIVKYVRVKVAISWPSILCPVTQIHHL